MEHLPNGITLELAQDAFPLSTDSMVLAHFAHLPRNARVLDLGSGCGTLGLLLCASDPGCTVVGVELQESSHTCALENIRRNSLEPRMQSLCADLRSVSGRFPEGSFSCCISNPPYFSGGPAAARASTARREDCCTAGDLMAAASWALKYGGDFYLVHRPERMAELISTAAKHRLETKKLCLLRHSPGSPVNLILLQLRKGAKPGLQWQEWCLHHADGTPTELYKEIYHLTD